MSSSRRNSPTEGRRGANRCPTCGSPGVINTTEDVVLRVGRQRRRFEHVEHERCEACGERIFGIEASQRFDAAILKGRGKHAA